MLVASAAHNAANIRYNKSRDNIMIRPTKEEGQKIRTAAAEAGVSVQMFILQTIRKEIDMKGSVTNDRTGAQRRTAANAI